MSTFLNLSCTLSIIFLYSCYSLDISQQINNDQYEIILDGATEHNITVDIDLESLNTGKPITIRSNDVTQPATIYVNTPIKLTNYGSIITFQDVNIDGLNAPQLSSFLQIDTNIPLQIDIINCRITNFNTTNGVIYIQEDINSFTAYNDDTSSNDQTTTTNVDILDIENTDSFVMVNFENSKFIDNTNYESDGGVLSLIGHEFQVNINDCTFNGNQVTAYHKNGGCISWDRSALPETLDTDLTTLEDEITSDNKVQKIVYNNLDFTANETFEWMISSQLNIKNNVFMNNYAEDAGGVVYIRQTEAYDDQMFKINKDINSTDNMTLIRATISIIRDFELNSENNKFMNNKAGQYGAVYRHVGYAEETDAVGDISLSCQDEYFRLNLYNDTFNSNSIPEIQGKTQSYAYGAGLSSACGQVTIQDSTFKDNFAKYGSAVSLYASSSINIDNCRFQGNNASFGTVYINGLLNADTGYNASIFNSDFKDNYADHDGAGILAIIITRLIVDNCNFDNNYNTHYGTVSVQYFQNFNQMNAEITNSIFKNNMVNNDDIIAGGAITAQRYDYGADVYPLNCYENGGFDDDIESLTLFIDSCQFSNNRKSAIGLRVVSAFISNSMFYNNTNQESNGGAIQALYSWFEVSQCNFTMNKAEQIGGAISTGILTNTDTYSNWILPCRIYVHHSNFDQNSAELGGAVFIGSSLMIENNKFTQNNGDYGGAVAVSAYNMSISENEFMNNNAEAHGGCLFQTQYSNDDMNNIGQNGQNVFMVITDNTFDGCTSYSGGSVFLRTVYNQQLTIDNNDFKNSMATDVGGAVVIGQLLPISEKAMEGLQDMNESNSFENNSGNRGFNDYVSYPKEMYIDSELDDEYQVSPGIKTTAKLGAYDIFGQDFVSFLITDWNTREDNFEFFLSHSDETPFELLTVNSGSLSAGKANISFMVEYGNSNDTAITFLGSNNGELISTFNVSWDLVECPPGYGYNKSTETCNLCERDTFKVTDGWNQCLDCLDGLSCRGGEHVQILYKNWWDSKFSTNVQETFYCRLGECCTNADGCSPESDDRCPDDRNPDSIGCGKCAQGLSAKHGTHICGDCTELDGNKFFYGAIMGYVLWPIFLVFLFGLSKYDRKSVCRYFYPISIIEITIILLIDYYQSLPAILTFVPDDGTYFLINLFFARIPIDSSGLCLFNNMNLLERTYWDLMLPSIILILSFIIFIISQLILKYRERTEERSIDARDILKFGKTGWVYDPVRGIMFALFFTTIPMLWSAAHLFKCIDYGEYRIFWNAPGQECREYVVALMAVWFVIFFAIYVAANIFYSNSRLINQENVARNKKLIPLYLQRLQPFYYMVYPFDDQNSRRSSATARSKTRAFDMTWENILFRSPTHFKYLYVGWVSPFLRKVLCLIAHATITGDKGQSDQTFIVTNFILATLVLYQLFSQDYTSVADYTLHCYCICLIYWLVLLIISGSTKIVSENEYTMQSLKTTVICIMWIPFVIAVFAITFAIILIFCPQIIEKKKEQTAEEEEYKRRMTLNENFTSATNLPGMDDEDDD